MAQVNPRETGEAELFFRQWLRSPKSMGSVAPSSRVLARAVTRAVVRQPGQAVVELGAGTGAISRGLLASGLPPDALVMVELDPPLCDYLRRRFPQVRVIRGDATKLSDLLREHGIRSVGTVVSGLPMVNMPASFQRAILEQSFATLDHGGCLLQYSYSPVAPIRAKKLGVNIELIKFVVRNLPPATLWRITPMNGQYRAGSAGNGGS
jgi:phosphatidylethanolamine/phosphatidyl-N-methylethanolamine N-methyltransferase